MDDKQTILVKKADGSFIHVPLSELNKKKEPVRVAKLTEQILPPKVVKPSGPAKHDLTSPLEEPAPSIHPALPLLSAGREKQVEEVIKSLSFKVPAGNSNRFRTIIQLFLKDIRDEKETIEVLMRKELEGGVGLSEGQADEVVQKSKQNNVSASTPKFDPRESIRLEQEVPAIIGKSLAPKIPVISTGAKRSGVISFTNGKRDSSTALGMTTKSAPSSVPVPVSSPEFKISADHLKTTMSDVKTPQEYAPVDEIRYFTLTDFRRIAGNPTDAASRLKQKFMNLRDESILLFFEALEAWRTSPLYRDYLTSVSEALARRIPLVHSGDKQKIQLPEIAALLEMEKDF